MTLSLRALTATLALLASSLLATPSAAGAPPYDITRESYVVTTRHAKIYVAVARPTVGGRAVRGPAILTYSPYQWAFGRNRDASRWVPRGYVRVTADLIGTGNSGGCFDYGGDREKESAYDLVEWIASRPWSTGKVAMIGGSYDGTTATAAAVERPPHLTTIVPEAAISRWYEYAYSGGIRYTLNNENPTDEGFDTPLAFDFGIALPPPLDVTGDAYADRVMSTIRPCDEVAHTGHGYDLTPDYDAFWRERDYIRSAGRITIPVLIAHNWGDWNVKQEEAVNLFRALDNSTNRKLYIGTRWQGHDQPGGDYQSVVDRWFDHYLMGVSNGIESLPTVTSQISDYFGPVRWYEGGVPKASDVSLIAQHDSSPLTDYAWKLLPTAAGDQSAATFVSTGTNTESSANTTPRANAQWAWFESPALTRDVRVFGNIRVRLFSTIKRRWITLTPTVVDVGPPPNPHGPVSMTRGFLDTRYRRSLATRADVVPGEPFTTTIVEKPQDYVFRSGHRIGLNISSEILEWAISKPYACSSPDCNLVTIHLNEGRTRVVLPVVNAPSDPRNLFR